MPDRIQRRRTKGWRMPEGAIYVGRPSRWGNPFAVGEFFTPRGPWWHNPYPSYGPARPGAIRTDAWGELYEDFCAPVRDRAHAVELFCAYIKVQDDGSFNPRYLRQHLQGHDLVCWCPLDQPCHADVLLAIANQEATP